MSAINIPSMKEDGVTITQINPDFPCGELEGITAEQVKSEWLAENYPNIDEKQLEDLGIKVEFVPGGEEYELDGESVTKEEYNNYNEENPFVVEMGEGNNKTLNTPGVHSDQIDVVGSVHKEPGHIEITIAYDIMNNFTLEDQTLTPEAADKLNSWFAVDTFISGMSIKEAVDASDKLLLEYPKLSNIDKLSSWMALAALGESAFLDGINAENMFDADESDAARVVNGAAKAGAVGSVIAGLTVATGGTAALAVTAAGILCAAVDLMIEDYDDIDVFNYNSETGSIEWDLDLKNSSGGVTNYRGSKHIEIDPEHPEILYNRVAGFLETAKIDINLTLAELVRRRGEIINNVKNEIIEEMEGINESSDTRALAEIHDLFEVKYSYINDPLSLWPSQGGSTFKFDSEQEHVEFEISNCGKHSPSTGKYHFSRYRTSEVSNEPLVEPTDDVLKGWIYVKEEGREEGYADSYEFRNLHFKNYYGKQKDNAAFNTFIQDFVEKDIVRTGEVDLWTGLQWTDSKEGIFKSSGKEIMKVDAMSQEEAMKNKTNFMSVQRIHLAEQMINLLYSDIMGILEKYILTGEEFKNLDDDISAKMESMWDNIL